MVQRESLRTLSLLSLVEIRLPDLNLEIEELIRTGNVATAPGGRMQPRLAGLRFLFSGGRRGSK